MKVYTSLLEKAAERKCEETYCYHANIIQKLGAPQKRLRLFFRLPASTS